VGIGGSRFPVGVRPEGSRTGLYLGLSASQNRSTSSSGKLGRRDPEGPPAATTKSRDMTGLTDRPIYNSICCTSAHVSRRDPDVVADLPASAPASRAFPAQETTYPDRPLWRIDRTAASLGAYASLVKIETHKYALPDRTTAGAELRFYTRKPGPDTVVCRIICVCSNSGNGTTMARRVPNTMLRELLIDADWTGDALAHAVNTVGAEAGMSLRYRRSAVAHWLTGMRPRPPVPDFVAEAFSRKLHRLVTVSETGLGEHGIPTQRQAGWWEMDTASRLVAAEGVSAGETSSVASRRYRLADLAVPNWTEPAPIHQERSRAAESAGKVERCHVRSAAHMVDLFSDADFAFGGGHARIALASYLAATIAPWLRASATPAVRRELLMTAARLTYLCGFMYVDDELHGAAQHYYLTNLRLATESGDRIGYAVTLRALSWQARLLGHHRESLHLAEAAVQTAEARARPQTAAFLFGQLAVAQAANGNGKDAVRHLLIAERHLDRARDQPEPVGGCHAASLAHQQAAVRAELGDRDGAIQALESSVRRRPAAERRSRALALARLAELYLDKGELDAACGTWHRYLQDYPHLRSRRVSRAHASMRARLRPHMNNTSVTALWRRAAIVSAPHLS
jgi:tetratricopeptide (TPR) repeat protein